jgi:hypothetical protein
VPTRRRGGYGAGATEPLIARCLILSKGMFSIRQILSFAPMECAALILRWRGAWRAHLAEGAGSNSEV